MRGVAALLAVLAGLAAFAVGSVMLGTGLWIALGNYDGAAWLLPGGFALSLLGGLAGNVGMDYFEGRDSGAY